MRSFESIRSGALAVRILLLNSGTVKNQDVFLRTVCERDNPPESTHDVLALAVDTIPGTTTDSTGQGRAGDPDLLVGVADGQRYAKVVEYRCDLRGTGLPYATSAVSACKFYLVVTGASRRTVVSESQQSRAPRDTSAALGIAGAARIANVNAGTRAAASERVKRMPGICVDGGVDSVRGEAGRVASGQAW